MFGAYQGGEVWCENLQVHGIISSNREASRIPKSLSKWSKSKSVI